MNDIGLSEIQTIDIPIRKVIEALSEERKGKISIHVSYERNSYECTFAEMAKSYVIERNGEPIFVTSSKTEFCLFCLPYVKKLDFNITEE